MSGMVRGTAFSIPLRDKSVNLVISSPPYFGQRSYSDDGEHYDGQIGSEPTPEEFLQALWDVMKEVWRVLADDGVVFINLGDKRSGSGAPGTTSGLGAAVQGERSSMKAGYTKAAFGRPKSKQLLPHRFAIGCADGFADPDGIGWIVRHDIVWQKPNGMPESVQDRPRDSHEYWFMLVKQGTYFSAIDEIRVPHVLPLTADMMAKRLGSPKNSVRHDQQIGPARGGSTMEAPNATASNPLGKVPDSVWSIPTEPLSLPEWLGVEHFAAFPTEWPRRLILGFAPNGICTVCHKGRFPVADVEREPGWTRQTDGSRGGSRNEGETVGQEVTNRTLSTIVGYACACTPKVSHRGKRGDWKEGRVAEREKGSDDFHAPSGKAPRRPDFTPVEKPMIEYQLDGWTAPPTTPAVVLDVFGGTGTTAMVARALGHTGVSLDLSYDYCRVARWRIFQSGHGARIESRTNGDRQGTLAL